MSSSDLESIFADIERVDWSQLLHAYGRATDVPEMLHNLVSRDQHERERGLEGLWGSLNHQGDFSDAMVAAVPFLIRFASCPSVPQRADLLDFLYMRYLDAPGYGGDPMLDQPPGGVDIPTPLCDEHALPPSESQMDEPDFEKARSMDLCAWQTGRAIRAGLPVYTALLTDPDKYIAGNAANLMLLWHESREVAKAHLRACIDAETDALTKAELLLKYGVYGSTKDIEGFRYRTLPPEPIVVRLAAALCWCRLGEQMPLAGEVRAVLQEAIKPHCDAFQELPMIGVYTYGLWRLPANMTHVLPRLVRNTNDLLRKQAVQAMMPGRSVERWLDRAETCPVLCQALQDHHADVRQAAAMALAEVGQSVSTYVPEIVDSLLHSLDDSSASVCGHAARLLVDLVEIMSPMQKEIAVAKLQAASMRFSESREYVNFRSMGVQASSFLKRQHDLLINPPEWTITRLWQSYAFRDNDDCPLSDAELCDRLFAEFHARPQGTLQQAIETLFAAKDRTLVLGVAAWLATLGPAAEPALAAINHCGGGRFDSYVNDQMLAACQAIERSINFVRTSLPTSLSPTAQESVERLERVGAASGLAAVPMLFELLSHDEWLVRFQALDFISRTSHLLIDDAEIVEQLLDRVLPLLNDKSADEIAIESRFEYRDTVYSWRVQRRSVALAAIRALFALGIHSPTDNLLTAMLQEASLAQIRCGTEAIVAEFSPQEWKLACMLVPEGIAVGELRIRTARQAARLERWQGAYQPIHYVIEEKLAEALVYVSGRLLGHDDHEW